MEYIKYLQNLTECPFCSDIQSRILLENDRAFLTYSKAPYHKNHLMIIPRRHVENIKDLTWDENIDVLTLVLAGIKSLNKIGHDDCTVLVRDGQALGKSIKHLHYNIIPGGVITDIGIDSGAREFFSGEREEILREELKKFISF
ncbi:MAG: HIT domain-containing protein [Patescibacteria group bacterium]|jgi:diadenosine tetraphosphate (Ap4A) HIT family hydrolase